MNGLAEHIRDRNANVAVIGQGYVGLVVAMRASEAGFTVVGLETNPVRARRLQAGSSYIEDVPDDVLGRALGAGYRPTSDPAEIAGFDVAVISVPTPLHDGAPDLSHIDGAARLVAAHLSHGACVILESTTYPGTTEEYVAPILERGSGLRAGTDFHLGYSPERIDPGNAQFGFQNTPKVVSGIDPDSLAAVDAFYSALIDKTVPVSSCGVAELSKIVENTYRHVNIALVNELAIFAAELGIDVDEALGASATKPFGFMRFRPGPGVGGHCLPIDPTYLSWRVKRSLGDTFRFIELANDVNDHMPQYVASRVAAALNRDGKAVKGARITILGLSYKPNVGDAREAPAIALVGQLCQQGAHVVAVDPHVEDHDVGGLDPRVVRRADLDADALLTADLTVLVTDHDAFDYDLVVRASRRVLDTRYRIQGRHAHVERL